MLLLGVGYERRTSLHLAEYRAPYQLDTLNVRQQTYNRALAEIAVLRKQLFADWYKYMLCAYPPDDSREEADVRNALVSVARPHRHP